MNNPFFTAGSAGIQQINASTDNQNVSAYVTIIPASFVEVSKHFRDLPWGSVITTAYYNDQIYAIVKLHNSGPDSTSSISVLDLLDGLTWTGNYYVYRTVVSYPNTESTWVFNDPEYTFNGTHWNAGDLSTAIGSSRWLAIEVIVNQTGTVSNYAETLTQSTSPYQGYANYTAYLTADITPTIVTVDDIRGNKGETVTLKAVLTDYLGNALTGETVEFWVDGAKVGENTTDSTGTALFTYVISQTPGNHTFMAVFNETGFYQGSNATGELYVPTADLYIQITSDKNSPTVGETFTLTYKLGNNGPDDATNVTITIPLPEGFVISKIEGDGNWTVTGNTITWTMTNITVGDPYLYITGWTTRPGNYLFTASITSDTFNINSMGISSLTLNAQPTVNAATTTNTVGMQTTGTNSTTGLSSSKCTRRISHNT
ncbi:MAG: Ig-like domain repeat protein [Methanobacterium sp.]|nr:Ig-like domain repeat protein [Methanobacterium sp.]